jgi:hypothetical protein
MEKDHSIAKNTTNAASGKPSKVQPGLLANSNVTFSYSMRTCSRAVAVWLRSLALTTETK